MDLRTLKITLALALALVAAKLLAIRSGHEVPLAVSLPLLGAVLLAGLAASLLIMARTRRRMAAIHEISSAAEDAWKQIRRIVILVVGLTVLALSIPIGALPGPGGLAVAFAGLAILATEFMWAKLLLRRAKVRARKAARTANERIKRNPRPWLVPLVGLALGGAIVAALHFQHAVKPATVLTVAIGPVLMWFGWSYMSLAAWIRQRTALPPADPQLHHTRETPRRHHGSPRVDAR